MSESHKVSTDSYRGDDGKVWSRPEPRWHEDFELIEGGEQ